MWLWDLVCNYLGLSANNITELPVNEAKGPAGLVDIVHQKTAANLQSVAAAHEKSLTMWNAAGFAKEKEVVVKHADGVPIGLIAAIYAVEMMERRR